jgi:glycosyltransferase involved in cell wall biosynthesis
VQAADVMSQPIVSVIITAYNRERFVGDAIGSILCQTFRDFELIVVDDGSSDGTVAAIQSFGDPRVRLIRHSRNRGIPAARDSGLERARGRFVAWLDSDDVARPHRLERQVRFLEKHPEVAMIGTCAGKLNGSGKPLGGVRIPPFAHDDIAAWLLFTSAFQQSSTIGRAAILKRFPYRAEYSVCEDLDLTIRLSREHLLRNLPEVLIDRRLHEGQTVETQRAAIREKRQTLVSALFALVGISYTPDDLARHIKLGSGKSEHVGIGAEFLDWAEAWLLKLVHANSVTRVIEPGALRFASAYFWIAACRHAAPTIGRSAVIRKLISSPVTLGIVTTNAAIWLGHALPLIAEFR